MIQITLTESQVRERAELIAIRVIVCDLDTDVDAHKALTIFKTEDPSQYQELIVWDALAGKSPDDLWSVFNNMVEDVVTTMTAPVPQAGDANEMA